MDENWSEKDFLENCKRMSFQELSECIEVFLNELTESIKSEPLNSIFKDNSLYEKIWSLLEIKFSDGLISEERKESFIQQYIKIHETSRKGKIGEIKTLINVLKGRISSLEFMKNKIDFSEQDLVRLYEKINPDIDLGKFKVQTHSAKPSLFIEVEEHINQPIHRTQQDQSRRETFYEFFMNSPIPSLEKFINRKLIKLNPKYKSQPEIKKLYDQFIEELPNFIDKSTDNIRNDLTKHQEILPILEDTFASQDLREEATKHFEEGLINGGIYFEFKPQLLKRRALIVRLRSKKRKIFEKVKFEIIPFDIFPKGTVTIFGFVRNLRSSGMSISKDDEMRLHRIAEKFPSYQSICVGKDKFKGFVVFRFEDTDVVIVEKPFYGNATYLIKGNWEEEIIKILQLSRNDARTRYHKQVKRVIHTSEQQWLANLKSEFKYWY